MSKSFTIVKTLLVCVLVLFLVGGGTEPVTQPTPQPAKTDTASGEPQGSGPFRYPEAKRGKGELKYRNGLPVLVVEGSPEEIGEQVAILAVKPGSRVLKYPQDVLQVFVKYAVAEAFSKTAYAASWTFFVKTAEKMVKNFPADYKAELESTIKVGNFDRKLGLVGNTMFDSKTALQELRNGFGCSTLFVEGKRTAVGSPLFGRNLDFFSAGYLHEYTLVTIYRQKGKHSFVSVGFPGIIGCLSGMNDAGLTVAVLEVYDTKEEGKQFDDTGIPYALCVRRLLEDCTTIEEAEKALRGMKRATVLNLAIGDRKHAAVFEYTPKSLVVRKPDNDICVCTNHFRSEELSVTKQCRRFDALSRCEDKVDLETLAKRLHAANQGSHTLQTMIFDPENLRLHLAFGECPSSALPMKTLELKELFKP
jgi:isopenicillin-N N-acyltransferase like protein